MAEATAEALRRVNADKYAAQRNSLLEFTKFTYHQYKPEPVHELIASTLDRVVRGEIKRLMIFAPPQHGKSELVSIRLPAFWLGNHPDLPVIMASYGADLARRNSKEARNIVESDEYRGIFPNITTRDDSRAANRWNIANHRGSVLAAGVEGPLTGSGAGLGIIDDPVKDWKEAYSEVVRESVWDWYTNTFRTRIWEEGAIILIMTRWHEDDLAGRILERQADKWEVLRLPAIAESQEDRDRNHERMGLPTGQPDPLERQEGEPLAPGRFGKEALDDIALDMETGKMGFVAEYQQSPRAPEGNRFKRSWFEIVHALPADCAFVRYWDKAGTDGAGAYTAGVLMARHPNGLFYVVNVVRGQWGAMEREAMIKQTAELDRINYGHVLTYVEKEPGSGGKESAEATIRNLAGFTIYADSPTGDKDVRLYPFEAQSEAENVKLMAGAWNNAWLDELCAIPNGKYRDQADASAGAFNKLTRNQPLTVETSRYA